MKRPPLALACAALLLSHVLVPCARAQAVELPLDREVLTRAIEGLSDTEREQFMRGRSLFRQSWVIAPAADTAVDGLGPLYNRLACISCHAKNGRGGAPEQAGQRMQSMLVRLSIPGRSAQGGPKPHPMYGDQLNEEGVPGVPGEGRADIRWRASQARLDDGTHVPLRAPLLSFSELAYGPLGKVLSSMRVSPHVAGLGLLEAVPEAQLQAVAREHKPDGVRGTLNRVIDRDSGQLMAGRFGLKANAPTLRQQIAGAFVGDMGITSERFPTENCTAAQAACRRAPNGGMPELSRSQLDDVEFYMAHLAPPPRRDSSNPQVMRGETLFAQIGCIACHRPALQTGEHPKFARLAHQTIHPYTDLLVHDMGAALADGRPDYLASGRQWRTAPLWGLGLLPRLNEHTGLLHDGRARTPEEAVLWHGGEARPARMRYSALRAADRAALLAFLNSL